MTRKIVSPHYECFVKKVDRERFWTVKLGFFTKYVLLIRAVEQRNTKIMTIEILSREVV